MGTSARHRHSKSTTDDGGVELPEGRVYDADADAELDAAIVEAIDAAENADCNQLAHEFRCQLGYLRIVRGEKR